MMDRHRARMAKGREVMRWRGARVEHPFGPRKRWAGFVSFLMRGFVTWRGEWNLMMLCDTFKRVLSTIQRDDFRAYCQAERRLRGQVCAFCRGEVCLW